MDKEEMKENITRSLATMDSIINIIMDNKTYSTKEAVYDAIVMTCVQNGVIKHL